MSEWSKYVYYDETSPSKLRWTESRGNHDLKDKVVGTLNRQGRWSFVLSAFGVKKRRYCHRVIWELFNGDIPEGYVIDHIDGRSENNILSNLRVVKSKVNHRNSSKNTRNKTGITGVSRIVVNCKTSGNFTYWVASWKSLDNKGHIKHFSVLKLGEERAKILATRYREDMIKSLNECGAGYTERHGT